MTDQDQPPLTAERLLAEQMLLAELEKGRASVAAGNVLSLEEVRRRMAAKFSEKHEPK